MFKTIHPISCDMSCLKGFRAHPFIIGLLLVLSGCATTPDSIVRTPMTATPVAAQAMPANDGAIFRVAAHRPLFEDRRARLIGDTITINITEKTTAAKQGASSASKDGSVDGSISAFLSTAIPKATLSANSSNKYDDKADANSSNTFNGSITVTVIQVLENGNLVVSGEKQVSFDKGTEFVRFSGVVNPDNITLGNFVASTQVADARIEYRTSSKIDSAQIMSILARFFLSFIPI